MALLEKTIVFLLIITVVWLISIFIILFSGRMVGTEKLAWIHVMYFISWFDFIFFLSLAPIKRWRLRKVLSGRAEKGGCVPLRIKSAVTSVLGDGGVGL